MNYSIHTRETAPAEAKEILGNVEAKLGFVPNLLGTMAEAPALLKAYVTLSGLLEETSFNAVERQIALLAVSYQNSCHYCMAAHSVIARMQNVPESVIAALRDGEPIDDSRLEALRQFTAAVVASRGRPADDATGAFLAAGYGRRQVLEVVLAVGLKTLSNYANHIAGIPLDAAFASAAWSRAA